MSQIKTRIKNQNKTRYSTISYAIALLPLLSACGNGGSNNSGGNTPVVNSQLILTAPSIVPSLPGKIGNNYLVVSNNSGSAISGINYSLGNQVGAGAKLALDSQSIANCSSIMAYTNCYIKLSVAESAIAGAAIVTASANNVNTKAAIGIQQVPFNNVANANGVGLYLYNKVQYSQGGLPYILVTAVVQSSKLGNINTIQLVNESGILISGQFAVSNNSGPDKSILQQGDVVEIALPIPQGVELSQNMKVQTSYQTVSASNVDKLSRTTHSLNDSATNISTGTVLYSFTTQGSNINLQLIPNQIFLTAANPSQSGFLYNIGDMTASQIQTGSSSQNVTITNTATTLNKQDVVAINYQLQNTASTPTINSVFATAQNPSGQVQVNFGQTGQNVSPNVTPTPSPTPTPTPSPSPAPGPSPGPSPSPIPALTITSNQNPQAGGVCSTLTATVPSPVGPATLVTIGVPSDPTNYGFAASAPYPSSATCTIAQGSSSCSTSVGDGNNLCAAVGAATGTPIMAVGGASGYTTGSVNLTVAAAPTTLVIASSKRPYAGGSCSNVTATISQTELVNETINFSVSGSGAGESFGFGLADSASYPTTASCTIAAGNTSCSLVAESLCATQSALAKTPIAVAASAVPGGYSASANTTVTATYAYIGNGGSGVIQCLVSDLDGTLSECVTKDDPITSDDLASVSLDPYTSYLYLLPSANKVNPYYYACPVNASGQYTNPSCLPSKAITTQYGSIAFALTNGTEYAYLAGKRDGSAGSTVDYCLVQESVLYCQPQYTGITDPNRVISYSFNNDESMYVYITPRNGGSIYRCDVTNSAGFGHCTSSSVPGGGTYALSIGFDNEPSLPAESSNYYAYITNYTQDDVLICPVESATGQLNCSNPIQKVNGIYHSGGLVDVNSVNCTANYTSPYNNKSYLYLCASTTSDPYIFVCPIDNVQYDSPNYPDGGNASTCYPSIKTNTTQTTNISFGTY